ncbi:MAG TPA: helix-turn-helix domain-containing protein [Jiangellaceae bacterium]
MSSNSAGPRPEAAQSQELLALRVAPPKERADAARNRAAVLDAAAVLFAEHGVEHVSLDAIAAEARVGKGTIFRRFGDKAGLAAALLDERERSLQERVLFGPAPLGPGGTDEPARPADRLRAFVSYYLDYVYAHLDLVRMSETAAPGARYRVGAYRFWHRHVSLLLQALRPGDDADALAHALLAPLAAEHLHAMLAEHGASRVRAATLALVDAVCAR